MSVGEVGVLLYTGPMDRRAGPSLAWHTARALRALGHRAALVAGPGPLLPAAAAAVPVYAAPFTYHPVLDYFVNRDLAAGLAREGFDVVHVQGLAVARSGARLAARLGIPWVLSVTEAPPADARLPLADRGLRAVIATNQEIREELVNAHGVPRDRIRVVGPGVDLRWFAPTPAFGRLDERVPVCGLVSYLDGRAGVEVLIDAAALVRAQGVDVHFLVVGDGPDARRLRRLAWQRGVANRVSFVPPETDYRLLLRGFDLCVSPKTDAGLRLSVLEAMASARPVVVSATGAVFAMVRENETGLVVTPGSAPALAKAVLALVRDPARARALGDAGRAWVVEHFNLAERAAELVDVYRRAITA